MISMQRLPIAQVGGAAERERTRMSEGLPIRGSYDRPEASSGARSAGFSGPVDEMAARRRSSAIGATVVVG